MNEHERLLAQADAAIAGLDDPMPPIRPPPLPRRTIAVAIIAMVAGIAALIYLIGLPSLSDTVVTAWRTAPAMAGIDSTDRDAVGLWLHEHAGFSVPIPPLTASGFDLVGARTTKLGARRAALLLYRAGHHRVLVMVWQSANAIEDVLRHGSHGGVAYRHWTDGKLGLWAATDAGGAMLDRLATLWTPPAP